MILFFFLSVLLQLFFFQDLINTYDLRAQREQIHCQDQITQRRIGRCDSDIGIMRVFAVRIGCSGTGHNQTGFLTARYDSLCTAIQGIKRDEISAVWLCPLTDSKSAKLFVQSIQYKLKFRAENVDGNRTHLNIDYCNERIQAVYHQLFDEALKRYNEKQARADRRISNYYEKIRSGNQEKPFHEIILQIGNKEDMSATGEYAELARTVLDKYYQGFQERNPNLRVFSAHLHMDEATPHIHIDFVPFTTGSKRGLDTRVSLKQALAAQGFKGGTRGATEWAQWVQSEKERLAAVMERYDIQWEQKGTHEKHLSVLDYKKQEREKEIAALDTVLTEKQDELETVQKRITNFDQGMQSIEKLEQRIKTDTEFQLPEPPTLMTAKTYKQRFATPLIKKLKGIIREVFYYYYMALDSYHRLNSTNDRLCRENEHLTAGNGRLAEENTVLRSELKDFRFLKKVLGSQQIDNLIAQTQEKEQQRKQTQRTGRKNIDFER